MGCREVIQNTFTAITFAEANCHDMAKQYLKGCSKPLERKTGIQEFASMVGLDGIDFKFGMAVA